MLTVSCFHSEKLQLAKDNLAWKNINSGRRFMVYNQNPFYFKQKPQCLPSEQDPSCLALVVLPPPRT